MTWLQALVALALFAPGAVAPSAHLECSQPFDVLHGGVRRRRPHVILGRWPDQPYRIIAHGEPVRRRGRRQHGVGSARIGRGAASGRALSWPRLRTRDTGQHGTAGKLVTDERRALVFSVRQTGNQIGAVCGSLALPAIAIWLAPQWSYAAVGVCADRRDPGIRVAAPPICRSGAGASATRNACTAGIGKLRSSHRSSSRGFDAL